MCFVSVKSDSAIIVAYIFFINGLYQQPGYCKPAIPDETSDTINEAVYMQG